MGKCRDAGRGRSAARRRMRPRIDDPILPPRMGMALSTLLLIATLPQAVVSLDPKQPKQPKTAEAALEAFEKEADSPEPQRVRGVRALGTWEGPKITEALVATLRSARTVELRLATAQALAD